MPNLSVQFHEGMQHRLFVIGVPNHIIKGLPLLVMKWVRCSGVEWTISRLKSLKVDLLRLRNGQNMLTPIRKNRKGHIFGVLGSLFRFGLKSEDGFKRAIQAFQIYTSFKFESLTQTQIKKFQTAINSEPAKLQVKLLKDLGRSIRQNFSKRLIDRDQEISLLTYRGSPSKFKPNLLWRDWFFSENRPISRKQNEDVLANANYFLDPAHAWLFFEYEDLYGPVLKGLTKYLDALRGFRVWYGQKSSGGTVEGGEIHFLQEVGGKLRSVASPHLVHQLALKPFGDSLYSLVSTLPWDCTHNQSKPFSCLQTHLSLGHTIHSVDLSSATDYFPLEIQMTVLKAIYGDVSSVRLFEEISRASWRTNGEGNLPFELTWKRGQPLGLYPSFAVFTLSHGLLLWYLNGCQHNDTFFVVGDDVVILSDELYNRYIKLLEQMNCPYSREKSISSANFCEFAGKIVTSSQVIPQMKWREISNDNFLDICRQLGCRSRSLLSNRQRRVFDKVKHCVLPYGLNFSFPGSNLKMMTEITNALFSPNDNVVGSLMGLSSVVNHNVYGTHHLVNPQEHVDFSTVLGIISTFDEKVRSVLLKILPKDLVATFLVFLKDLGGLSGVPEAVSNRELPSIQLLPSRVTVLERMEKLLSL